MHTLTNHRFDFYTNSTQLVKFCKYCGARTGARRAWWAPQRLSGRARNCSVKNFIYPPPSLYKLSNRCECRCPPSVVGTTASEWAGADVTLPAAGGAEDPQSALLHAFLATTAELRDRVRRRTTGALTNMRI